MNAQQRPNSALIAAVCASLQEAIDAATTVTPAQFAQRHPEVDADSIGAHLRHHIEHLELLFAGAASGTVNYDARCRDPEVERDPAVAVARCQAMIARLERLDTSDLAQPLRLVQQTDANSGTEVELQTTLGRELLFMHSHAVHHHAIIAILLRAFGQRMNDQFGVMPSTTVWRQQGGN